MFLPWELKLRSPTTSTKSHREVIQVLCWFSLLCPVWTPRRWAGPGFACSPPPHPLDDENLGLVVWQWEKLLLRPRGKWQHFMAAAVLIHKARASIQTGLGLPFKIPDLPGRQWNLQRMSVTLSLKPRNRSVWLTALRLTGISVHWWSKGKNWLPCATNT